MYIYIPVYMYNIYVCIYICICIWICVYIYLYLPVAGDVKRRASALPMRPVSVSHSATKSHTMLIASIINTCASSKSLNRALIEPKYSLYRDLTVR